MPTWKQKGQTIRFASSALKYVDRSRDAVEDIQTVGDCQETMEAGLAAWLSFLVVDLDIVGLKEIAERLGVKQQTAAAWRYRGLLPAPEGTVSGAPAWNWATIDTWARSSGRLGGIAEFMAEKTYGWRVMDGAAVEIMAGVVVRQVSAPFPHQMPDGRVERRVRFMAAGDGQWYELPYDLYQRGTGASSAGEQLGKALLAAGAILGAIIVVGEASKGRPPT